MWQNTCVRPVTREGAVSVDNVAYGQFKTVTLDTTGMGQQPPMSGLDNILRHLTLTWVWGVTCWTQLQHWWLWSQWSVQQCNVELDRAGHHWPLTDTKKWMRCWSAVECAGHSATSPGLLLIPRARTQSGTALLLARLPHTSHTHTSHSNMFTHFSLLLTTLHLPDPQHDEVHW